MTSTDTAATLAALPRGRHNLTRTEVERSQRFRLAVAMADACAESGFANTSVKAVLEGAGVSRLTFYDLYEDKLDCFLEALDLVGEMLFDRLGRALNGVDGSAMTRASHAVDEYLETIVDNLSFARLYIVEVHAAGSAALRRRAELHARIVDALAHLFGATTPEHRFACEAYVAAVSALVTLPVATADADAIRALRDPLATHLRRLDLP